jgi:hypothetical protein
LAPQKAAVDVDLRTSGGRVATDLPVAAVIRDEQKKNEIRRKCKGGGPLITARTGGGNIQPPKQ